MRYLVLIALMFLVGSVQADTTTITSLPYSATQVGTNYSETLFVDGNLNAVQSGITFTGEHIVLIGTGDTIFFNTDDNNAGFNEDNLTAYGLNFSGSGYIRVEGLTVIQSSSIGAWVAGANIVHCNNVELKDCNLHVKGPNSKNISTPSGGDGIYNIEIDGGNYTSFVDSFTSRCQNDAAVINGRNQGPAMDSSLLDGYYTMWVHNITIDSCPHVGVNGTGRMIVDNNTIYVNAHNDQYDPPSGEVCWSADNAYAIRGGMVTRGTHIFGNTIRVRDTYEGGRGILIEGASGTSVDPVLVYDNDIIVSQGPSDAEAIPGCWGLRFRQDTDNGTPNRHIKIYNNTVVVNSDSSAATTHIGVYGVGIWFSDPGEYASSDSLGESCFVYHNTITAYADSNNFDDGYGRATAMLIEVLTGSANGHKSYDNRLNANGTVISFGGNNGGGDEWTSERDTLNWFGSAHYRDVNTQTGDSALIGLGNLGGAEHCTTNVIIDPVFIPSSFDEDYTKNVRTNGTKDVNFDVTYVLTTNGNNALPVSGASVWLVDAYGDSTLGTSDVNGLCSLVVSFDYKRWVGTTPSDSTFNPYTLGMNSSTDSTTATSAVAWNNKDTVMVFASTAGSGVSTSTSISGNLIIQKGVIIK